MEFKYPNTKELFLTVEISQLFHKYNCTFRESKDILALITDEIDQQFKDLECDETDIVHPLNHVEPYC